MKFISKPDGAESETREYRRRTAGETSVQAPHREARGGRARYGLAAQPGALV